ncbi:patatin-like phospholipase family protein [Bizionia arctica]|uniref:Patatin n=1 Tax=Bizionia arctica TaxID=1495645 RepID=A0A917GP77_9FLAO|nr:patatin-like phospholipase family protein [Bizionia arctica]GGG52799.1 patatin [Bizionia arctica]
MNTQLFSQEKKPKVALVLSGGGAKGIAHIPVIQALDSLGIVPDLIIGTSMGSIVGGLYAMGYSGDSIAKITKSAKWTELLGGSVSFRDVGVEEKSEFGRYLLNVDVIKGKPKMKASILKDQNLREFLSTTVYPVYNVSNFDDLSIPFRAVATDLVKGEVVVLDQGSLAVALRASMSIPSVFQPVPYNETLLVDGGVMDNFPVDVAVAMGADIIIGSDVGGGLQPIEKLNNIPSILFQTSMLTSNIKNPENRALCTILIDHVGNLTYSTEDFASALGILKEGEIATKSNIDQLAVLADSLKKFKQRDHALPVMENAILFSEIQYHGISNENLSLVQARMAISTNSTYNITELTNAIERAMGTELFYQITYSVKEEDGHNILNLYGLEKARNQLNGALHYDTTEGVGVVVNYTGRNILGYSSRLLVGLDIAEAPKYRVQYQQNVGETKNWWWRAESFGQKTIQNYYLYGSIGDDLKNTYNLVSGQLNKNLNSLNNYVGFYINYEYLGLKPKSNPDYTENVYDLRKYKFNNFEVGLNFNHNSMNKVFFATSGSYVNVRLSRSLGSNIEATYNDNPENNITGSLSGFTKLNFQFEKRVPITTKTTLIGGVSSGIMLLDDVDSNDLSLLNFGQPAKYTLGGSLTSPVQNEYAFQGLNTTDLIVTQFIKASVGAQINPLKNIYVTPYLNLASVGFDDFGEYLEDFYAPKGNWINTTETSLLFSGGTSFSYNSILGPVNFDVAYINDINKLKFFFSVGLRFNIPH